MFNRVASNSRAAARVASATRALSTRAATVAASRRILTRGQAGRKPTVAVNPNDADLNALSATPASAAGNPTAAPSNFSPFPHSNPLRSPAREAMATKAQPRMAHPADRSTARSYSTTRVRGSSWRGRSREEKEITLMAPPRRSMSTPGAGRGDAPYKPLPPQDNPRVDNSREEPTTTLNSTDLARRNDISGQSLRTDAPMYASHEPDRRLQTGAAASPYTSISTGMNQNPGTNPPLSSALPLGSSLDANLIPGPPMEAGPGTIATTAFDAGGLDDSNVSSNVERDPVRRGAGKSGTSGSGSRGFATYARNSRGQATGSRIGTVSLPGARAPSARGRDARAAIVTEHPSHSEAPDNPDAGYVDPYHFEPAAKKNNLYHPHLFAPAAAAKRRSRLKRREMVRQLLASVHTQRGGGGGGDGASAGTGRALFSTSTRGTTGTTGTSSSSTATSRTQTGSGTSTGHPDHLPGHLDAAARQYAKHDSTDTVARPTSATHTSNEDAKTDDYDSASGMPGRPWPIEAKLEDNARNLQAVTWGSGRRLSMTTTDKNAAVVGDHKVITEDPWAAWHGPEGAQPMTHKDGSTRTSTAAHARAVDEKHEFPRNETMRAQVQPVHAATAHSGTMGSRGSAGAGGSSNPTLTSSSMQNSSGSGSAGQASTTAAAAQPRGQHAETGAATTSASTASSGHRSSTGTATQHVGVSGGHSQATAQAQRGSRGGHSTSHTTTDHAATGTTMRSDSARAATSTGHDQSVMREKYAGASMPIDVAVAPDNTAETPESLNAVPTGMYGSMGGAGRSASATSSSSSSGSGTGGMGMAHAQGSGNPQMQTAAGATGRGADAMAGSSGHAFARDPVSASSPHFNASFNPSLGPSSFSSSPPSTAAHTSSATRQDSAGTTASTSASSGQSPTFIDYTLPPSSSSSSSTADSRGQQHQQHQPSRNSGRGSSDGADTVSDGTGIRGSTTASNIGTTGRSTGHGTSGPAPPGSSHSRSFSTSTTGSASGGAHQGNRDNSGSASRREAVSGPTAPTSAFMRHPFTQAEAVSTRSQTTSSPSMSSSHSSSESSAQHSSAPTSSSAATRGTPSSSTSAANDAGAPTHATASAMAGKHIPTEDCVTCKRETPLGVRDGPPGGTTIFSGWRNTAPTYNVGQPSGDIHYGDKPREFSTATRAVPASATHTAVCTSPRSLIASITGARLPSTSPVRGRRQLSTNCHEKYWTIYNENTVPGYQGHKNIDLTSTPPHRNAPRTDAIQSASMSSTAAGRPTAAREQPLNRIDSDRNRTTRDRGHDSRDGRGERSGRDGREEEAGREEWRQ